MEKELLHQVEEMGVAKKLYSVLSMEKRVIDGEGMGKGNRKAGPAASYRQRVAYGYGRTASKADTVGQYGKQR